MKENFDPNYITREQAAELVDEFSVEHPDEYERWLAIEKEKRELGDAYSVPWLFIGKKIKFNHSGEQSHVLVEMRKVVAGRAGK